MDKQQRRDEMYRHIAGWKASGKTQKQYCEECGERLSAFQYWIRKQRDETNPAPGGFAQVISPQIAGQFKIVYPNVCSRMYDEKGQLKKLKLHQAPDLQNYMQNINYRYNDQGQLTHINNTALIVDAFNNDDDDVFGQELTYFDASPEYYIPPLSTDAPHSITPQYGGNISSMMWNAKTPEEDGTMLKRHAYVYEYDDLNNLTHARYGSDLPSDPGNFNVNLNYYNENLNYDLGGNIMRLNRNRDITPGSFPSPTSMDNLSFTYNNNGYSIKAIDDSGEGSFTPARKHFIDNSTASTQYLYDQSGRLIEDKNRKIGLTYNHLGLPSFIKYKAAPYSIEYMYDAAGNKLQKFNNDEHICPSNEPCAEADPYRIDYIGNFVYERGELKMIYHPEGVIRPIHPMPENPREYAYDYFIKDYLGNVRVVLTEEDATITKKFLTTLEEVHRYIEEENFDNVELTAEDLPTGYPVDGSVELNEKIARLSAANGTEIGPSIVLPVRRGDKVSLRTDYFYTEDAPGATYDNLNMLVNEVLLALVASGSNILRLSEGQLIDMAAGGNDYSNAIGSFFSSSFDTTDVTKPHAYLVWMLYDNNMQLIPSGSGVQRVTDPNALEELIIEQIPVEAEGYLHAYVSNGSTSHVAFDNFLVKYIRGKTRQINHYYPYGLSIDGLDHSDEYLNKYTSKELQTGEFDSALSSGLEMFDFGSRFYDPQVGRWFTPDPAEQFSNPYLGIGNNPVVYVDPDGEFIFKFLGTKITLLFDFLKTGFTDGGFEFWNWGSKNFNDAWREFDPTAKWSKTNKALRMDLGLFKTDKDKNFLGRTWQFTKRHTWQKYNTILGNLNSHKNNITGDVQRVDYFHGSTVVYNCGEGGGGSSLGGYININQYDRSGNAHETNFGNALLLHEYGHYLQEQAFGPLTLFSGINSGLSANGDKIFPGVSFNTTGHHDQAWFEQDANARSLSYFSRKDDFNNYLVGPGFSAADNFNADFPFQYKTNRFLWYLPPFTLGHILYTAFKRTNP